MQWRDQQQPVRLKYGHISTWDVSQVTNMEYMFYGASAFNGDVAAWDVSAVTTMEYMFQNDLRLYFVMPFVRGGELYKIYE